MISRAIYFIDSWVRANIRIGACNQIVDPDGLAMQCIDEAAKAGISRAELEENLGTDLIDFLSHELTAIGANRGANRQLVLSDEHS